MIKTKVSTWWSLVENWAHFVVFAHSHSLHSILQFSWEIVFNNFPHVAWSSKLCCTAQVVSSKTLENKWHWSKFNLLNSGVMIRMYVRTIITVSHLTFVSLTVCSLAIWSVKMSFHFYKILIHTSCTSYCVLWHS